jgi:putative DeoR family transcriptional regulator (stage III sporulation protein D)
MHRLISATHSIGGIDLTETLEKRSCDLAVYIIETGATVRQAAKEFHISKSTVHKDLQQRLRSCNPSLFAQVRQILDKNKQERHIRGGLATRRKYKGA